MLPDRRRPGKRAGKRFCDLEHALRALLEVVVAAAQSGRVALQISEQCGCGTKDDRVAGQHCGVSDIFGEQGFAEAVGAQQNEIARFGNEVEGEGPLD